ncbi:MAG: haloacid dehalogenase type II [Pelagibacterales bacterium]|nr:haloacid dehalogenase type II [Pelagibacterales bacterium]
MIKALLFDVFGTVVDWRTSVINECLELEKNTGIKGNWVKLTDMWRQNYMPSMDKVRNGEREWVNLDTLHKESLIKILKELNINGLSEKNLNHLNTAWHRLSPWSDTVEGLNLLKSNYSISTLSNGGIDLLTNMANKQKLPWDNVFSAETFMHYKPDSETYLGAVEKLNCETHEVMLVAAHNNDLLSAKSYGLKTAFVVRATEYGANQDFDLKAENEIDLSATDFIDLSYKLTLYNNNL